jgi:hypothetical protein
MLICKALELTVRDFWPAPRLLKAAGVLLSDWRVE